MSSAAIGTAPLISGSSELGCTKTRAQCWGDRPQSPSSFYRAELDVLRFFAFCSVLVTHGSWFKITAQTPLLCLRFERLANMGIQAGQFGVCLFFMLSAFLITELLLLEREHTGTVRLKAFYIRRALRIWPLYYLALCIALVIGNMVPEAQRLSLAQVLCLVLFVSWVGGACHSGASILWSISVEELFYLFWPSLVKRNGARTVVCCSIILVPISFGSVFFIRDHWINPLVQSLFFALGGLLAVLLRGRRLRIPISCRSALLICGLVFWLVASFQFGKAVRTHVALSYLLAAIGCLLIFVSFFDMPANCTPKSLAFAGKISYGLYIFHPLALAFASRLVHRIGVPHQSIQLVQILGIGLAISICIATASYRFIERPFLRLKERFTLVPSRAI